MGGEGGVGVEGQEFPTGKGRFTREIALSDTSPRKFQKRGSSVDKKGALIKWTSPVKAWGCVSVCRCHRRALLLVPHGRGPHP